jgi:hypothetical protein
LGLWVIAKMLLHRCQAFYRLLTMPLHHRQHQVRLAGEMVVNAGLAYPYLFREIRIAEAVVAAGGQQLPGVFRQFSGAGGEFNSHRINS